jgi:hypothetical protein
LAVATGRFDCVALSASGADVVVSSLASAEAERAVRDFVSEAS